MNKFSLNNKNYPEKLKQLSDPPNHLYCEGRLAQLIGKPALAVVGSRKASHYGQSVTDKLVKELASHGIVIVSGLAFGIDSIAHKAALSVGGYTIAVLPCGLDNIYPRTHIQLAKDIISKKGCLISEYPPKSNIFKHNFVARNRIVAALCDAILITEAAARSGSLHTANFALELGREVFAIPGPITSTGSEGCNNLIKAGARPATSTADILDFYGISNHYCQEVVAANDQEFTILRLLKEGISDSDELQQQSGLDAADFMQIMSLLEISGKVSTVGSGQWSLK